MSLFLDSASLADARTAMAYGFVRGITTNPTLLAKEGVGGPDFFRSLLAICPGEVCYQLVEKDLAAMEAEGRRMHALAPGRLVLKIPATLNGFQLAAKFRDEIPVAMTAIFHPSQAYIGVEAGVRYIIAYVNRATRAGIDGPALVADMVQLAAGTQTQVMAASIKSLDEAAATRKAGAHVLTVPLAMIQAMAEHPLSIAAIEEFDRATQHEA